MAQFTFSNNTYAGEALAGFMASTLLEADTVTRGLITVLTDVKARKVLLDADDEVKFQDPSGVFNDQGTTALQNESYLDPVVYEFMKQEQWDKLIQSWESQSIKPGSFADYEGVVDLSDHMVNRYLTKIQIANDRLYWLGKGATKEATFTAAFPGLLPSIAAATSPFKVHLAGKANTSEVVTAIATTGIVLVADSTKYQDGDVVTVQVTAGALTETTGGGSIALLNAVVPTSYFIQVVDATHIKLIRNYNDVNTRLAATFGGSAATAATLTFINASNVLQVLKWVYAQLDPADRTQDDFNLMIPFHVAYAYAQAQAEKAVNVLNAFTDVKKMDYLGMPLQIMNHWQANTMLGARAGNLFLGVDLLGDESALSTVYLKPYTNDDVVRMKARMKAAVNFKFGNELFYLSF
jgi:hypothetical protein